MNNERIDQIRSACKQQVFRKQSHTDLPVDFDITDDNDETKIHTAKIYI